MCVSFYKYHIIPILKLNILPSLFSSKSEIYKTAYFPQLALRKVNTKAICNTNLENARSLIYFNEIM